MRTARIVGLLLAAVGLIVGVAGTIRLYTVNGGSDCSDAHYSEIDGCESIKDICRALMWAGYCAFGLFGLLATCCPGCLVCEGCGGGQLGGAEEQRVNSLHLNQMQYNDRARYNASIGI